MTARCHENEQQMLMQAGRRAKIASGIFPGHGSAPFGYRKDGKQHQMRLIVDEPVAMVVQAIYRWFVDERHGMSDIVRRLEAERIAPPGKPDYQRRKAAADRWSAATVRQILSNEVYAGTFYANRYRRTSTSSVLRPREEWIAIVVPALVDRMTWDVAQTQLAVHPRYERERYDYLMRHRLRCGCGYAAFGTHTRNNRGTAYRYYECGQRHRSYGTCPISRTSVERVDELVWRWVVDAIYEPCLHAHLAATSAQQRRTLIIEHDVQGTVLVEDGRKVLEVRAGNRRTRIIVD